MPETFDYGDKGCKENPSQSTLSSDAWFDTLTLNPFETEEERAAKFLNPFEQDEQSGKEAPKKNPSAPQLRRPKFPESVEGAVPYTVKPGDSLWSIARDTLESKTGSKPSVSEVKRTVKEMAETLGGGDPASILLHPGDKVFVPVPGTESKTIDFSPSDIFSLAGTVASEAMGVLESAKDAILKGVELIGSDKKPEIELRGVNKLYDGNGNLTELEVKFPQGTSRDFKYDLGGTIFEMSYTTGDGEAYDAWKFDQADGKWHQYKPDARGKATGETWQGEVQVDQTTGELVYTTKLPVDKEGITDFTAAPTTVTERADGTKLETWFTPPYDHTVVKDKHDRITQLTASNSDAMKIEYAEGKISQVLNRKGSPLLDGSEKSVSIDESYGVVKRELGGGEIETHQVGGVSIYAHSDGSKEMHTPEGAVSRYSKSKDGREELTNVYTADGRRFDVGKDASGKTMAEYTVQPGDSLSKIAEDWMLNGGILFSGQQSGSIPKDILRRAAEDIAQASGITDPNTIRVGQKITLPPSVATM